VLTAGPPRARARAPVLCAGTGLRPVRPLVDRSVTLQLHGLASRVHSASQGYSHVLFRDLMAFKQIDDAERKKLADELTAEAQRLGLDY